MGEEGEWWKNHGSTNRSCLSEKHLCTAELMSRYFSFCQPSVWIADSSHSSSLRGYVCIIETFINRRTLHTVGQQRRRLRASKKKHKKTSTVSWKELTSIDRSFTWESLHVYTAVLERAYFYWSKFQMRNVEDDYPAVLSWNHAISLHVTKVLIHKVPSTAASPNEPSTKPLSRAGRRWKLTVDRCSFV